MGISKSHNGSSSSRRLVACGRRKKKRLSTESSSREDRRLKHSKPINGGWIGNSVGAVSKGRLDDGLGGQSPSAVRRERHDAGRTSCPSLNPCRRIHSQSVENPQRENGMSCAPSLEDDGYDDVSIVAWSRRQEVKLEWSRSQAVKKPSGPDVKTSSGQEVKGSSGQVAKRSDLKDQFGESM